MTDQRWWICDLADETSPGGHLYEAPNARSALAKFRADMVEHYLAAATSRTHARDIVRANRPRVYGGPLTAAEAFEHELGWAWAWEMCSPKYRSDVYCSPDGRATRDEAVMILGERITALMERQAGDVYGLSA
jgi:hypothetical protein